jgi:hypothetical protein
MLVRKSLEEKMMPAATDPLAELPPAARRGLEAMAAKLPADWKLTNPRRTATGWVVSIHASDGTYGGEIGIMDEPADGAHHKSAG